MRFVLAALSRPITVVVALIGVWAASRAAQYWGLKDPQRVVIDEVSGQHITLLVGCTLPALVHGQPQQPERTRHPRLHLDRQAPDHP